MKLTTEKGLWVAFPTYVALRNVFPDVTNTIVPYPIYKGWVSGILFQDPQNSFIWYRAMRE